MLRTPLKQSTKLVHSTMYNTFEGTQDITNVFNNVFSICESQHISIPFCSRLTQYILHHKGILLKPSCSCMYSLQLYPTHNSLMMTSVKTVFHI